MPQNIGETKQPVKVDDWAEEIFAISIANTEGIPSPNPRWYNIFRKETWTAEEGKKSL